jgi:hypothetical protein
MSEVALDLVPVGTGWNLTVANMTGPLKDCSFIIAFEHLGDGGGGRTQDGRWEPGAVPSPFAVDSRMFRRHLWRAGEQITLDVDTESRLWRTLDSISVQVRALDGRGRRIVLHDRLHVRGYLAMRTEAREVLPTNDAEVLSVAIRGAGAKVAYAVKRGSEESNRTLTGAVRSLRPRLMRLSLRQRFRRWWRRLVNRG